MKLLELLWRDGFQASVNSLAKLSEVSFSAAYEELLRMEQEGLARSEVVGRSRVFSKNDKFEYKKLLLELVNLEKPKRPSLENKSFNDRDVEARLANYGAPLGFVEGNGSNLSLEQALAHGLKLAHKNPTVARVLPLVLYKNMLTLNFEELKFFAEQLGERQALGLFLDLTATLSANPKLKKLASQVRDKRFSKIKDFFETQGEGKYTKLLAEKNTPQVAKKWKYRMNMELETFQALFDKFVGV